jgi:hypothetical protein
MSKSWNLRDASCSQHGSKRFTSIEVIFCANARSTRFYIYYNELNSRLLFMWILTRNVATQTRITFSLMAPLATLINGAIISCSLMA